ncbi:MAG: ABC transporter ATP-binding protein [Patescibacteria group bacterium]|nr:ABC transporter ATP-binding protein [Patescibacteria group bacterium]
MKNNTRKTLKIYWEHSKVYKLELFIMIFSVIGASILSVIVPLYFKAFFDILVSEQSKDIIYNGLISTLISIIIIEFIQWILWRSTAFSSIYFQSKILADLTNLCFRCLHKHSFSYFNNNFTGSLVKRVNYFVRSFENITDRITWDFIPLIITISTIVAILFSRNSILGIIIVLWIFLFMTVNWILAKYKMKYDIRRSEAETKATGFLADTITNNSNIKLFCGYKREVNSFVKLNKKILKLRIFTWNLEEVFNSTQTFLMIALEIGIFYFAIQLWKDDLFTVGDFVLLQSYVLILFMKLCHFGKTIRQTYQNLADAEEMTEILNTPCEIKNVYNAKNLKITAGKIKFEKMDFYYHKTRKVFKDFNFFIKPCERVALIGPSGAGKTTIIKLLLRNHDVSAGKILIDGQDISRITQESLWKNISLVPQDPILFHRTLMENIRYGKSEATNKEVIAASKLAHCHEFIVSSPEGYNTYVGERGIKLSEGERQRVAIARAILRNAPILILDEATSSLDSQSESLIQDALAKLMENKTVIVIATGFQQLLKWTESFILIKEALLKTERISNYLKKKMVIIKNSGSFKLAVLSPTKYGNCTRNKYAVNLIQ